MPRTPTSNDDGQTLGSLLLLLGMMLVLVGIAVCGYVIFTGGLDADDPPGGGRSGIPLAGLGFAALVGGGLLAVGALVAKSVGGPRRHRSYGAYLDLDDDDEW